jgi:hypothetical protein
MTSKQKAIELVDKFKLSFSGVISADENWEYLAKQCALIAVDEMINQFEQLELFVISLHWSQVKQEIENL